MSPGQLLKEFLIEYIQQHNLDESLVKEIPKKWEKYGDFVLFDERTFCSEIWKQQGNELWMKLSEILKCKRIGLKSKIKSDGYRTPNVKILFGSDSWVLHRDNGILYSWNVEKCMFSAGNACEKLRIAKLSCENEIVVDMFAGIGYFTLPFLVHSKAVHVHACEWNPPAIEALKKNLKLNKVENKCTIHEGDNRVVCPKKIANRVNLGLIPSSESFWKTACEALVENGGILHIHENIETKKDYVKCNNCLTIDCELDVDNCKKNIFMTTKDNSVHEGLIYVSWKHKQWLHKGIHILNSLISILSTLGSDKEWLCTIESVNFVKSYAPHVNHLVYDVKVETFALS